MKAILFVSMIFAISNLYAQGKYSGPVLKKIIGRTYTDDRKIPGLSGYQYREGSLITDVGDPYQQSLNVYWKGSSGAVVILSMMSDTVDKKYHVVDIVEIKNIAPGWDIKTAGCQVGEAEGEIIVALVKPGNKEYTTAVKQAYRCNRDKIRFEMIPIKNIRCLNEGQD